MRLEADPAAQLLGHENQEVKLTRRNEVKLRSWLFVNFTHKMQKPNQNNNKKEHK